MATVRAYSVCMSDGESNAPTVYSYSPSESLQDGSTLAFDAANPEDAMRTGLSQAYAHGGSATSDTDAIGYANAGGLTPTLISAVIGTNAALAANTAVDEVGTLVAGTGNVQLPSCARVICSTTNISANDTGAGLLVAVSTNADGETALLNPTDGDSTDSVVEGGRGYQTGDVVGIDGFPGSSLTLTVTA